MKNRKPILFILLTVLSLIIGYNYIIVPTLTQNNYGMGMNMHMRSYTNTNNLVDFQWILILAMIIAGLLLYEIIKPQTRSINCSNCGKVIEDERWMICPLCGEPTHNRKG